MFLETIEQQLCLLRCCDTCSCQPWVGRVLSSLAIFAAIKVSIPALFPLGSSISPSVSTYKTMVALDTRDSSDALLLQQQQRSIPQLALRCHLEHIRTRTWMVTAYSKPNFGPPWDLAEGIRYNPEVDSSSVPPRRLSAIYLRP